MDNSKITIWKSDWDTIHNKVESLRKTINQLSINDLYKNSLLEDIKSITRKMVKTNDNNKRNDFN